MKSIFLVEKALNPTRAAPVARLPFSNSGRSCLRAQQWQLDHSPSPYPKRTKFPPPVSKIVQMLRIQALRKFLSLRKLGKSGPDFLSSIIPGWNIIASHFLYGLSQLMSYPMVCAGIFQSARCELLVPNQHSPGE